MTTPAVTVLVDTYNHERFIEEAIQSVLQQDFPASEMEIIVVDDGSTDRTAEILRKFEPRVRLLRKTNGGQASAFNVGIPEARGEIVAFLDGDDWWKTNKLSAVMVAFRANPEAGVVGHGIIQVDHDSQVGSVLSPETPGYFDMGSTAGAQVFRNYMCFLGTSRVAIRRQTLNRVLPVPESLRVEADEFMSAVSVALQGAVLLSQPLTFYRLHDRNLYQFRGRDEVRLRNKMNALDCLSRELGARLSAIGLSPEAVSTVVDPILSSVGRMRLVLDGGSPWKTYRLERADLRHSYGYLGAGYRAYKQLSLAIALLMPPRYFYQLRDWYSAKGLRRWRKMIGEPKPMAAVIERRMEASDK